MTDAATDRLYDRNFLLALVSQTSFVIANTLMAHYARWVEFLGGNLTEVGWVMGIGPLLGLLLRPWMAQWINRLGARTTWAAGFVFFGVASVVNLLLVQVGPAIYVVRACLVLGTALVFTSGLTYISQTSPDHRRTEAIGVFGIGGFLGMLIGPFLGDLFLYERAWPNFATLFLVAAAANFLPAIGLCFLRPVETGHPRGSVRLSEFVSTTRRYWPGMILLVDLTFGVCMAGPFVFVASYIDGEALQLDGVSMIGLFFLCYAGMGITVRLSSRRLPDRVGAPKVVLWGLLFLAAGMFSFGWVDASHSWMIVVPAALGGVGHGLTFHTMTSLTLDSFPREVRGTGSAIALMMLDLGTIAGAPVLGWIGERYGFVALFRSIGCLCLITMAAYAISRRRHRRETGVGKIAGGRGS